MNHSGTTIFHQNKQWNQHLLFHWKTNVFSVGEMESKDTFLHRAFTSCVERTYSRLRSSAFHRKRVSSYRFDFLLKKKGPRVYFRDRESLLKIMKRLARYFFGNCLLLSIVIMNRRMAANIFGDAFHLAIKKEHRYIASSTSFLFGRSKRQQVQPLATTTTRTMSAASPDAPIDEPYTVPDVWTWANPDPDAGNKPTAGARYEKELPVGRHPLQLYSMGTPNGQKITILLEELLEAGRDAEYDAWLVNIFTKEQFSSGFVDVNPNSKIPALVDKSGEQDLQVFESGSILLHLAEKFDAFIPKDPVGRVKTMNWLFFNIGSAPTFGNLGHFFSADVKIKYAIDRMAMETKRILDVLNQHLAKNEYLAGEEYTIADIANYTWVSTMVYGTFNPKTPIFLNAEEYTHVLRWAETIAKRPAVQRGQKVNKFWGPPEGQLKERHDASDFDVKPKEEKSD
jgi:GST-like protein